MCSPRPVPTWSIAEAPGLHSRNVCVFAEGELDRSPTGTGVSGREAIHHARGELGGEWLRIASILGTSFEVRIVATLELGGVPAVVPEVRGRAHIIGRAEYWLDPEDPLGDGFLLRCVPVHQEHEQKTVTNVPSRLVDPTLHFLCGPDRRGNATWG